MCTVRVSNIVATTSELETFFRFHGEIKAVQYTSADKSVALIEYTRPVEAESALLFSNSSFHNSIIEVDMYEHAHIPLTVAAESEHATVAADTNMTTSSIMSESAFYYSILPALYQQLVLTAMSVLRAGLNVPSSVSDLIILPIMQQCIEMLVRTNRDIYQAVIDWCRDPVTAEAKYGHISHWNVSKVSNMQKLFHGQSEFNDDISAWDVSSVVNMSSMFSDACNFNQDIGGWNVSKVRVMYRMFYCAIRFNQDIRSWEVSPETKMENMFFSAKRFNQDLSVWDRNGKPSRALTRGMFCNTYGLELVKVPRWYSGDR